MATNCIEELNFAKKLSECRSRAAALEEENMRTASLLKQLPKDIKALRAQETSTYNIIVH